MVRGFKRRVPTVIVKRAIRADYDTGPDFCGFINILRRYNAGRLTVKLTLPILNRSFAADSVFLSRPSAVMLHHYTIAKISDKQCRNFYHYRLCILHV